MDVRKGYPKTVSYRSQATSENGSPVFYNKACTLAPMKVGSETIKFLLVHLVEVDGYGRFFITSYETPVDVTVTCSHTFGDGVVIREGSEYQDEIIEYTCGACGAVSAGSHHTVGLLENGTVVATGVDWAGQCDVSSWRGVVAVAAGAQHTVGVLADGCVVANGYNRNFQCDVLSWRL